MAVSKKTGDLIWSTKIEEHSAAIVTQSPIIFGNRVYVGVSSIERLFAADPDYPCCTFRGSVVALDVNTGEIIWKTYTVPDIVDTAAILFGDLLRSWIGNVELYM